MIEDMENTKGWLFPPGRIIRNELILQNMSIQELSRQIPCSPDIISAIIHTGHEITPEMAKRLSKYLGGTSELWLDYQQRYKDQMEKLFNSLGHRFDELG